MAKYLRHAPSGKVMVAKNARSIGGGAGRAPYDLVVDGEPVRGWMDLDQGEHVYMELDGSWHKVAAGPADWARPLMRHGLPSNFRILSSAPELETITKSELDAFLEGLGVEGYSPY